MLNIVTQNGEKLWLSGDETWNEVHYHASIIHENRMIHHISMETVGNLSSHPSSSATFSATTLPTCSCYPPWMCPLNSSSWTKSSSGFSNFLGPTSCNWSFNPHAKVHQIPRSCCSKASWNTEFENPFGTCAGMAGKRTTSKSNTSSSSLISSFSTSLWRLWCAGRVSWIWCSARRLQKLRWPVAAIKISWPRASSHSLTIFF